MMRRSLRILCVLCVSVVMVFGSSNHRGTENTERYDSAPELLTFDELVQLYQQQTPEPQLQAKLNTLLTTPFVSNRANVHPLKPTSPQFGRFLRVAQWNIERGLEFDAIKLALTNPTAFSAYMDQQGSKLSANEKQTVLDQIRLLDQADVIVLNEADWGVNRTLFRNVTAELAEACQMNYAYGVEFVEVDPATMGLEQQVVMREVEHAYMRPGVSKSEMLDYVKKIMTPDPSRYHGLHGTAILSRYPLQNVRLIPLKFQGHDWYGDEKRRASAVTRIEGRLSDDIFKEQLARQVRRGGRMMLLADITDPELPAGRVTIVATHLEDMTTPANRKKQLVELLDQIKGINNPVVLAGDMNTSTHDAAPIGVSHALKERFGSAKWWAEDAAPEVVGLVTPVGWAYNLPRRVIGFARNIEDPTVRSIPLLGSNPEAGFFKTLDDFRFTNGSAFDFDGDAARSSNGRSGKLADSNERSEKGFVPTSELGRTYGPIGKFKLDWIFVSPGQSPRFAPYFGRTLKELNESIPEHLSDHSPIIVDLPL